MAIKKGTLVMLGPSRSGRGGGGRALPNNFAEH